MEVVVHPDGVEPGLLGLQRAAAHRFELLDRVADVRQVHAPALGQKDAELQLFRHALIVVGFRKAVSRVAALRAAGRARRREL